MIQKIERAIPPSLSIDDILLSDESTRAALVQTAELIYADDAMGGVIGGRAVFRFIAVTRRSPRSSRPRKSPVRVSGRGFLDYAQAPPASGIVDEFGAASELPRRCAQKE